ncbi:MAG: alpha amylase C-terminal domain-containing protein [Candidatus Krumholzibacteriales bacterium]
MKSLSPIAARLSTAVILCSLIAVPADAQSAAPDNNIEWNGVSHIWFQDRRPLCPVSNQAFSVRFQAYRNDLTSARIYLDDGGSASWITASVAGRRGPYDIWEGAVPATSSATGVSYYIELTDGTDTDYLSVSGVSDGVPADGGWALNFNTLEHAPFGATPATGGVVFRVWAPGATSCYIRGDFNSWGLTDQMDRAGDDFIAFVPGAAAGQEYKYYFEPGDIWKADARARAFNSGSFMNSIIEDPFGYNWVVEDFDTPELDQMIVYQLHVGTFAGRNDPYDWAPHPSRYIDVGERAAHLAELGVNTVMLNPITEFPGDLSGGYNPVSSYAPEWAYGQADRVKYMVDLLHQNGIAVLLDIVWNHVSYSDNYLWYYDGTQIYFDDPVVETPWGSQADLDRQEVRDYYLHSALHWLEEYNIDGFRMDATDYMTLQGGGWSLMQELNDLVDNRFADRVMIAEQLPDDDWVTRPTGIGGAGFDSQYFDYFVDSIREEIFDAALGDPEMWKIRDIINGGGTYLSGSRAFNYMELHDEAWEMSGGQRMVKDIDTTYPHDDQYARGRVKLGQGVVNFAPGIPAFLMGLDWLEDTDFGSGSENRIDWSKKTEYNDHFTFFKDMIELRKNSAFHADASHTVFHINEGGNVIGFRRWDSGADFVVIANFSNTDYSDYRIGVPEAGSWYEQLNSQDSYYGGSGPTNCGPLGSEAVSYDGYSQSITLNLAPMALVVIQYAPAPTGADDASAPPPDILKPCYPNPFNPSTSISFSLSKPGYTVLRIYDVSGRLVRTVLERALPAGAHSARWDGRNQRGEMVTSGVYFCRLESERFTATRRMVLLR